MDGRLNTARDPRRRAKALLAAFTARARANGISAAKALAPVAETLGLSPRTLRNYATSVAVPGFAVAEDILALEPQLAGARGNRAETAQEPGASQEGRGGGALRPDDAPGGIETLTLEPLGEAAVAAAAAIEGWCERARPGARVIYARAACLPPAPGAVQARKMMERGYVHLAQRRADGGGFLYLMIRRPDAPAPARTGNARRHAAATKCTLILEDGIEIDLAAPDPALFDIERIARYLARIPRWVAHLDGTWSVAEHCVWVADHLPHRLKLQGLLHDAPEAIIGDMPSPMKAHLPVFRAWEDALWRAIAGRYGLPLALDPEVKLIDRLARVVETRDLRRDAFSGPADRGLYPPLEPLRDWEDERDLFLDRYDAIMEAGS